MDKEYAKQVLSVYRPSDDPTDEVSAALVLLESDWELAEWFANEQAFDRAIRDKLLDVQPPAALLEGLQNKLPEPRNVVALTDWRTNRRQVVALVATLVTLFAVIALVTQTRADKERRLDRFRSEMVDLVKHLQDSDLTKGNHAIIAATLKQGGGPVPTAVTARFGKDAAMGCLVRDWHDHRVSMICLKVSEDGQIAHLFAIAKQALSAGGQMNQLGRIIEEQRLETKAWQEGGHYFLLVGGSEDTKLPNV